MASAAVVALGVAVLAALPVAADAATLSAGLLGGSSSKEASGEPFTWSDDADCSACHVKQAESFEKDGLLAHNHAAVDCMTCHDYQAVQGEGGEDGKVGSEATEADAAGAQAPAAGESMAEVHADVAYVSTVKKSSLVNSSVSEGACLSCHDRQALVEATKDSDVLTDAHGTVVNPHELIEGEQHESITCGDCHKMHVSDTMAAYRACVSCHHAEVWECGTCHSYVANKDAK